MDNTIKKPNDIFVATLSKPDATLNELVNSGVNPENTALLTAEEYKSSKLAQKHFTDENGTFHEDKFNEAYIAASNKYKELTDVDFFKNIEKEIEYNQNSLFRPAEGKVRDLAPKLVLIKDPYQEKRGLTGVFSRTPSDLSMNELAQRHNVFDPKTGKFTDKSPNDLGLLGTLFSDDTIVYATYDEDGLHQDEETGRMLKHKKGQRKVSPDGNFYTEYLGDREVYGKQILSSLDVLTKEDSLFNSVDFFDSDGKTKSAWGTTFKLIAQIAPYTIPGFNTVWGGITASYAMASVLPTFYKSIEGIISGEDDITKQSDLWKFMNKTEGTFSRLSAGKSEEAQNSMFNYEQIGGLVADVFSQIYQQRAVASLSKYAKTDYSVAEAKKIAEFNEKFSEEAMGALVHGKKFDPKKVYREAVNLDPAMKLIAEKQSKLAKSLSLSYMALTTTGDIYGEAIGAGYDRRTAGIASLLAAGGQYGVMMNNEMGTWFLDKTTGYSTEINRGLMKKSLTKHMAEINDAVKLMDINKGLGRKGLGKAIVSAKQSIKNTFTSAMDESEVYWKAAVIEGVEEVTEEAMMDATKGIVDTMNWLGLTAKNGSFDVAKNIFSKRGFERYVTALVGGAVGGPLFKVNEKVIEPLFGKDAIEPEVAESVAHYVANGQVGELIDIVNKTRNSLGNKYISPTKIKVGSAEVFTKADGGLKSESDIVADVTIEYLKQLDGMMNQENLKITDENLIKKALLNQYMIPELENSGIDKLISRDFIKLVTSYNADKLALNSVAEGADASELATNVKTKKEKLEQLLKGDLADDYLMKSLMLLNKDMYAPFFQLNISQYTTGKYKQKFAELQPKGNGLTQESVIKEYKEFKENNDLFSKIDLVLDFYKTLQGKFSNPIKDYINLNYGKMRNKMIDDLYFNFKIGESRLSSETGIKDTKDISKILEDSKLPNFTIKDVLSLDVSDYLESLGAIDYGNFSDETVELADGKISKKIIKDRLDGITSTLPIGQFNSEFFETIFEQINNYTTDQLVLKAIEERLADVADDGKEAVQNALLSDKDFLIPILQDAEKYHIKISKTPSILGKMSNPHLFVLLDKLNQDFDTVDPELVKQIINDFNNVVSQIQPRLLEFSDMILSMEEFSAVQGLLSRFEQGENNILEINQFFQNLDNNETSKNAFDNLMNLDMNEQEISEVLEEFLLFAEEIKSLAEYQEKINLITKKQLAKENPLYAFLKTYNLEITGVAANTIFELLEEEDAALKLTNISDYIRPDITKDALKSAKNTLEIFKSIVTGMFVKQGENDVMFGFNHAMQNFVQKHGLPGKENYATITPEEGFIIQKELNHLINKINFLMKVATLGEESKAIEHIKTRIAFNEIAYKLLTEGNFKYESKPLMANKEEIMASTDDIEVKIFKLKRDLYQGFINLGIKKDYKPFLKDFFGGDLENPKDLFKQISFGFSGDMTALSNYDAAIYLLHILAIDPLKLEQHALKIVEDDAVIMAPFFGQEYDAAITQSFINNSKVFNDFAALVSESYAAIGEDEQKEVEMKPFLENMVFINGIAGSGKTSAVGQNTVKNSNKVPITVLGPTLSKGTNLHEALTKNLTEEEKSKVTVQGKDDFFKLFLDDDYLMSVNTVFAKITNSTNVKANIADGTPINIFTTNESWFASIDKSQVKFKTVENPPKIIMIDEITHFTPLELDLLSSIAKKHGIVINVFGDTTQSGFKLAQGVFDISHRGLLKTPVLNSSIRSNNNHQADNILNLRVLSQLLVDKHSELDMSSSVNLNSLEKSVFSDLLKDKIFTTTYFEFENIFAGSKFIKNFDVNSVEFKKSAEIIIESIKANPTYRLGLITDYGSENQELQEYLLSKGLSKDNFKFYSANTYIKDANGNFVEAVNAVQGEEMEFVISLAKIQEDDISAMDFALVPKTLYTLTSRALIGSVIFTNNFNPTDYNIVNKEGHTPINRPLPNDKILALKTERKNILIKMLEGQTPITAIAKTPIKPAEDPELEPLNIQINSIVDELIPLVKGLEDESEDPFLNPDYKKIDAESGLEVIIEESETKLEETETPSEYTNFLMLHTFYNRTGLTVDVNGNSIFRENGNQDLGLLKGEAKGNIIIKSTVASFILLKNSLSLHLNDSEKIIEILKANLQNKGIINDFGLTEDDINNLKIVIINSTYNVNLDNPKYKAGYDASLTLKAGNKFSRIAIQFGNNKGTVTLGVLPKRKTLIAHLATIEALDKINQDQIKETLKTFDELTKTDGTKEITFEKVIQTSGLRMIKLKHAVPLNMLSEVYPGVILDKNYQVFPNNEVEIIGILNKYGFNKQGEVNYPQSFLEYCKGRVYTVASVANDSQNPEKLIVVLKPNNRRFRDLMDEFSRINVETDKYNYEVKKLFNRAQGAELYREVLKIINKPIGITSIEKKLFNIVFERIIKQQPEGYRKEDLIKLFALHANPDTIKWEDFNFNIGTYMLTVLKHLTQKPSFIGADYFDDIKIDFFYNPVPFQTKEGQPLTLDTDWVNQHFSLNWVPETPRHVFRINTNPDIEQNTLQTTEPEKPIVTAPEFTTFLNEKLTALTTIANEKQLAILDKIKKTKEVVTRQNAAQNPEIVTMFKNGAITEAMKTNVKTIVKQAKESDQYANKIIQALKCN